MLAKNGTAHSQLQRLRNQSGAMLAATGSTASKGFVIPQAYQTAITFVKSLPANLNALWERLQDAGLLAQLFN
jgi:hypothetical protein